MTKSEWFLDNGLNASESGYKSLRECVEWTHLWSHSQKSDTSFLGFYNSKCEILHESSYDSNLDFLLNKMKNESFFLQNACLGLSLFIVIEKTLYFIGRVQLETMACRYAYLFPIWVAFLVHQLIFSPHFQTLRTSTSLLISESS